MAIELVTGKAGFGHVSSADLGRLQAGICGADQYVLSTGGRFPYIIESANQITIGSGDAVDQGRHVVIPTNSSESVGIQNGNAGKVRIDLIVIQYSRDTTSPNGIETAELVVIKGTEVAEGSTPTAPRPTSGDIIGGASLDQMPLYEVLVTAQGISTVTAVFDILQPLAKVGDLIDEAMELLLDRTYPVGSIYMSVSSTNPATLFGGTWEQLEGKFLLGASSGHAAGSTGGAETVKLSTAQLPAHTHTGPAHTHSVSGHTHSVPNHTHTVPAHTHTATCASAGVHHHDVRRTMNAASGSARYSLEGATDVFKPTLDAGAHTHSITIASKAAFSTNSTGSCTTGSGGSGNTGSAGTGATGSTGSGSAVSIIPPFLAVYMWKRTA